MLHLLQHFANRLYLFVWPVMFVSGVDIIIGYVCVRVCICMVPCIL